MKDGDVSFTFLDSRFKRYWCHSIPDPIKKCAFWFTVSDSMLFFFQEELLDNLGCFERLNFFQSFFAFYSFTFQETEIWESLWWIFPEERNIRAIMPVISREEQFFSPLALGLSRSCWAHPTLCILPIRAAAKGDVLPSCGETILGTNVPF